jgi:crossover junction endodeoxyribonuclease RuvC
VKVIGIDPGLTGALASWDGTDFHVTDMPILDGRVDDHRLADVLTAWGRVDLVVLEEVSTRPGLSAKAVLTTGINWGIVFATIGALERPRRIIRPQTWTKALEVGADKDAHRAAARRLFPDHADLFARKRDDGRADAALIAWWARGAYR